MAYKRRYAPRRYNRRRRNYRSSPWYKKKYSVAQIATKAAAGVRYLSGLVNSERFKHDLFGNLSNVTNTGAMLHLTGIAVGNEDSERTGNSIFVRHVTSRLAFNINSSYTGLF